MTGAAGCATATPIPLRASRDAQAVAVPVTHLGVPVPGPVELPRAAPAIHARDMGSTRLSGPPMLLHAFLGGALVLSYHARLPGHRGKLARKEKGMSRGRGNSALEIEKAKKTTCGRKDKDVDRVRFN